MFDTINQTTKHLHELVRDQHIHNHLAPTDDSIRLYNELLEKAKLSLLESNTIECNGITAAYMLQEKFTTQTIECYIRIKLNSETITRLFEMDNFDYINKEKFAIKMRENIAECITLYVLKNIKNSTQSLWGIK